MIEPSVRLSLVPVVLALQLKESDLVTFLCQQRQKQLLTEQPDRRTRQAVDVRADSNREGRGGPEPSGVQIWRPPRE